MLVVFLNILYESFNIFCLDIFYLKYFYMFFLYGSMFVVNKLILDIGSMVKIF